VDRQFSGGFRLMWQKKHNENRKVENIEKKQTSHSEVSQKKHIGNLVYLFELLLCYIFFSRAKKTDVLLGSLIKINLDG
jgi:hypothetical protein